MSSPGPATTPYQPHNHQLCINTALATAKQLCSKNSAKLTSIREQVLTIILQSHSPCGAYRILEMLASAEDPPCKLAPPTVYRALEFLLEHGLIHRIASLNAYIACCRPARKHQAQFLLCQRCEQAMELNADEISSAIMDSAKELGFAAADPCVEIFGLCPECLAKEPARHDEI